MKLCKNCKHYKKIDYYDRCYHPAIQKQSSNVSLITGKPFFTINSERCSFMRYEINYNANYLCGESGKLYEPNRLRKLLIKLKVVTE